MPESVQSVAEIKLTGVAAAPGVAHGPAFLFIQDIQEIPVYEITEAQFPGEMRRFEGALAATRVDILKLRAQVAEKLGENEAAIFDAHLLVLEDPALMEETLATLSRERVNIEEAYRRVSRRYMDCFAAMDDDYLKERVADIRDVSTRLLHNLLGSGRAELPESTSAGRVLVCEDITPSDAALLESGRIVALVSDAGNRTSHAVIMAKALGIPAVVGLIDATTSVGRSDMVLVDGFEGAVYFRPSPQTLARYKSIAEVHRRFDAEVRAESAAEEKTADGAAFVLAANIGGPEDIDEARRHSRGGVGLYRSEALFLKNNSFPDEETQYEAYRAVVAGLSPSPVVIRTLDIGGDKRMPAMKTEGEENPFMGFRAIRFCLEHRDIFKTQLRAILRAGAHGTASMMFPMIASVSEVVRARAILEEAKDELRAEGAAFDAAMRVGVMIEIPSAALTADALAAHCDFFSVGTNDLVQYLLAVDRGNERIANLYDPCHPVVAKVLREVVLAAKRRGIPIGVCGEIAGDPVFAPLLVGLGVDSLSMSPVLLPEVRYLLRRTTRAELTSLAREVLDEGDPARIGEILRAFSAAKLHRAPAKV